MHVDVASFKRIINILIAMFLQRFSLNFHFLIGISKQSHKKKKHFKRKLIVVMKVSNSL